MFCCQKICVGKVVLQYSIGTCDYFEANFNTINNQILQEPEARSIGGRVVGGISQRLAARLLQQVLRAPSPTVK